MCERGEMEEGGPTQCPSSDGNKVKSRLREIRGSYFSYSERGSEGVQGDRTHAHTKEQPCEDTLRRRHL